ncbi:histidine kinase N-terminal 7TM domain-containing protein [Methanoplanus limicola]|uniref:histidine kinase n=1 Tax=Methanoplanus limicola DSM 2279 TaxID=937775 RepID=H1Z365_9EURY|nr:histidine kinase N-terminal 7TM domain-containing protein [Methanoplanus limicola]EHQ35605.1 multi-sensor signal transduction histidine kinase [Methanoplanus limicola DSM 2279]
MIFVSAIFLFTGIFGLILISFVLAKKPSSTSNVFILLLLAVSYYSITYGIELALTDPEQILLMIRIEYFGIVFIPPLWLIFVLTYTRHGDELKFPVYALFFSIPVLTLIVINSGYLIPLLYQSVDFVKYGDLLLLSINPGLVYLLNASYFILAFAAGIIVLFDFLPGTYGIIKKQVTIIIYGAVIPLAAYIAYIFILGPYYHIDISPLAFLSVSVITFWALFRYRLFSLTPLAYDLIFHAIPSGVLIVDNSGYVIGANDSVDKLLECNIREDSGKLISEYYFDWPEFDAYISDILKNNPVTREVELSYQHGDLSKTINIRTTPLKDRYGHNEGLIIILLDVTERRNAEETLRKSEGRFRNLFLQSPVAYQSLNCDGEIIEINPEWSNILGYEREEVLGKPFSSFFSERTSHLFIDYFRNFLTEGSIYRELELVNKSGQIITAIISGRIQRDSEYNFVRTHCILHDITARKKNEESLNQANKKLNLLSGITRHDILNQLTILKGYQDLSMEYLSETVNSDSLLMKYLEKESSAADIIHQQIKFTEDYQDIGIQSPKWQNVKNIFVRSVQYIDSNGVDILVDVGNIEIYADPLLEKVFYNLVENALHYGDKLTKISLSLIKEDEFVILVFEDDGIGIPESEKENIFNRKYFRNTGLGMFLSREILSITGINIKETGIPGEGARFEIIVPKGSYRLDVVL